MSMLTKNLAFSVLALLLGALGLVLVFSDLGPTESWLVRILVATSFFLISGAIIGFFNPTWWMISGFTAWGGLVMGGFITRSAIRLYGGDAFSAQDPPYITAGLIMLFLPITFSLIGGYVGKLFAQMRRMAQNP